MNKFFKALISIMGGVEIVFDIFIPFAVVFVFLNIFAVGKTTALVLLVLAIITAFYKSLKQVIKIKPRE